VALCLLYGLGMNHESHLFFQGRDGYGRSIFCRIEEIGQREGDCWPNANILADYTLE
jgi:hypothetical protein